MSELGLLFLGVLAVLGVGSLVGAVLKQHVARGQPHPVIDNLNARIGAWWVMVGTLGLCFWLGKAALILLFALLSALALREFVSITYTRRADHLALALAYFVALPAQYFLVWIEWYGLFTLLIPVYAFLVLPIVSALRGDASHFLERVAIVQWALMLAVFALSHLPALVMLEIPGYEGQSVLLIAFLVAVVQSSDVLQYVWGKLFGRRPVAPTLSPSKTWEGLIGGVLSATALGAALWWLTPFSPWEAAGMALVINLMGFCGGLVMSAIKREHGIKDWGHLIAGHGGVIDRLDSVLFAAPVFFHLTRYAYVP